MTNKTYIGDTCTQKMQLSIADIAAGATALGDINPIHFSHEEALIAGYPGIIASGAHTAGLCGGALTRKFQHSGAFMGLDCSYRFHRAVLPNEELTITWTTVRIEHKMKLKGSIAFFEGKMTDSENRTLISSTMQVLLKD